MANDSINRFTGKQTTYFKVADNRRDYLGEKFFAMSGDSDTILQVCNNPGKDIRRGRTNAIGIYTITRMSFATNYISMGYVEPITKKQFKTVFDKMITALQACIS